MTVTGVAVDSGTGTLTVTADFAAPVDRVWQAWADPRLLERWWGLPPYQATIVDHDLTPGGRVSYVMSGPEGDRHPGWWRILATDPPRSLAFEDGFADPAGHPTADLPTTTNRVLIQPAPDRTTRMTVRSHFRAPAALARPLERGMQEGLAAAIGQIDGLLAGMDRTDVVAAVEQAFAETGAGTPPWPDPHPGGRQPLEEEYSRCLDPGKYRILAARTEAWVRALTRLGLAARDEAAAPTGPWRDGPPGPPLTRATWVRPHRPDAVPLLVATGPIHAAGEALLCLGAGDPAVLVLRTPDCGCDACDCGSESLLAELDDHVWAVVSGSYVHMTTAEAMVASTGSGWSAGFTGRRRLAHHEVERLLADARAGRSRHRVVRGAPWFTAG